MYPLLVGCSWWGLGVLRVRVSLCVRVLLCCVYARRCVYAYFCVSPNAAVCLCTAVCVCVPLHACSLCVSLSVRRCRWSLCVAECAALQVVNTAIPPARSNQESDPRQVRAIRQVALAAASETPDALNALLAEDQRLDVVDAWSAAACFAPCGLLCCCALLRTMPVCALLCTMPVCAALLLRIALHHAGCCAATI